jgi:hypothetical protein
MKYSLSPDQIEKIKKAHEEISSLQRQIDVLFDTLVSDIGFQDYNSAYSSSSDLLEADSANPMNWLFDAVYNSSEDELDASIKQVEIMMNIYNDK